MKVLKTIKEKIIELEKFVDVKNDKLSKVVKYFQEEIRELEHSKFSKKDQIEFLSNVFDREIKYTTYVDLFKKYIDITPKEEFPEKPTPLEGKKEESNGSKSEDENEVSETPIEESGGVKKSILNIPKRKKQNTGFAYVDLSKYK